MAYNSDYYNQSAVQSPAPQAASTQTTGVAGAQPATPAAPSWDSADPYDSPSYRAFLRSAGLDSSQTQAQISRSKSLLGAQLEAQRPVWAQALVQGVRGDLDNAAGRGTVRSSNRIENQNQTQTDIGRQQASYETNIANQLGNLDLQSQQAVQQLQQQQAEQALAAQNSVYQNQATQYQDELSQYYLQQLLAGGGGL